MSPAKVNLFLKVTSKRPDGYHNLVSVVDIISIYDVIRMQEARGGEVVVRDDRGLLPHGAANTIYRAIMLIKERYGVACGYGCRCGETYPDRQRTGRRQRERRHGDEGIGASLGPAGRRVRACKAGEAGRRRRSSFFVRKTVRDEGGRRTDKPHRFACNMVYRGLS